MSDVIAQQQTDLAVNQPAILKSLWMIEHSATRQPGPIEGASLASIRLESGGLDDKDLDRYVFCHVNIGPQDEDADRKFEFNCRWGLTFEANENMVDPFEGLLQWVDRTARAVAEPYIRQVLTDTLTRCGMPALLLPLGAFQAVNAAEAQGRHT